MAQLLVILHNTNQFMSLRLEAEAHGCRHNNTTTESALAGMKPSKKTFRQPQL